jgi:hypothetical protein
VRPTAAHWVIMPGIKTCWTEVAKSPCLEDCLTSRKGVLLILHAPGAGDAGGPGGPTGLLAASWPVLL